MSTSHEVHLDKFTIFKSDHWYGCLAGDLAWTRYNITDHVPATFLETSGVTQTTPRPYLWYYQPSMEDLYKYSAGNNNLAVLCSYYTQLKVCKVVLELKPLMQQRNLIAFPDSNLTAQWTFKGWNNSLQSNMAYCVDPLARQMLTNNIDNGSSGSPSSVPHGWDDILSQRTNGHKHSMSKTLRLVINPSVSQPIMSYRNLDTGNLQATLNGASTNPQNIGPPTDYEWYTHRRFPWVPTLGGLNIGQAGQGNGMYYMSSSGGSAPSMHGCYIGFPRNLYQPVEFQMSITFYFAFKNRRGSYYQQAAQR